MTRAVPWRVLGAALLTCLMARAQHPDHLEHRFDKPAESAKSFDDPARDAWQKPDQVIAALKLRPGQAVADIGSGTGYFSVRLARVSGIHVYGADIEPAMVEYLKARAAKEKLPNITAVLAQPDNANLPVPVDLVLIVDTYHHIGNRVDYFRRLAGSLKAGGRVAIIDLKADSPTGPPKEFRFPVEKIRSELSQAGFRQVESYSFLPYQHFLVFAKK